LSFICIGLLLSVFGGEMLTYSYLARPFVILGEPYALNRIAAFLGSVLLCACLYVWLHWTRAGLSLRAVAVNPAAAALVGIDVERAAAMAFALGGAVSAAGGSILSMFLTFDASVGVIFTLKALVIIILGGVADVRGAIVASFILGLTETIVATFVDPGLTLAAAYLLFIIILLVRPEGLFGRRSA
jgi:branched-chain amino acid transport system permease protein